jgi:hypothetical protein
LRAHKKDFEMSHHKKLNMRLLFLGIQKTEIARFLGWSPQLLNHHLTKSRKIDFWRLMSIFAMKDEEDLFYGEESEMAEEKFSDDQKDLFWTYAKTIYEQNPQDLLRFNDLKNIVNSSQKVNMEIENV